MGKEVKQFVAKDGGAAWFEDDYRDAAADLEGFLKNHPDWGKAAEMRKNIAEWRQ